MLCRHSFLLILSNLMRYAEKPRGRDRPLVPSGCQINDTLIAESPEAQAGADALDCRNRVGLG